MATDDRWRGWLLPGAGIVAALILVVYTIGTSNGPGPEPSSSPSHDVASAAPLDDHVVTVDDATIRIELRGSSLVVTRSKAGSTVELARASTTIVLPSANKTPTTSSSTFFLLACDTATANPSRMVFGHLDGPQPIAYSGPPADGQGAPDGLFLFILKPGVIDNGAMITVKSANGGNLVGVRGNAFATIESTGAKQPSGCYLVG